MSRPSFIEGALVALAAAVGAGIAGSLLPPIFGPDLALRGLVLGLAGAYLCYLIRRSRERSGRVVIPVLWLAASVIGWSLLGQSGFLMMQIFLLSVVRSLYFHGGPLGALADLGLAASAMAGAAWALGSGSWALGAWTFFLIQALFPWIPGATGSCETPAPPPEDRFEAARKMAQAALERLVTKP